MALAIQSTTNILTNKKKHSSVLRLSLIPIFPIKTRFTVIRSTTQSSSSSSSSSPLEDSKPANGEGIQEKKPNKTGVGFGSLSSPSSSVETIDNKKKGARSRERGPVIRRTPVEKPAFLSQKQGAPQVEKQSENESAFLLTWLGLGCVILIQGLTLSASGMVFLITLFPYSFFNSAFLFLLVAIKNQLGGFRAVLLW